MSSPAPTAPAAAPEPSERPGLGEDVGSLAEVPLEPGGRRHPHLLRRLHEPARTITLAYQRLAELPPTAAETSQAAEWLLDNYHIVQRAVRGLREEFPRGFERKLRVVAGGPRAGAVLAYALAREAVTAAACRIDVGGLIAFLDRFQTLRPLHIAEVWAFPALVRLALLERLADAAAAVGQPLSTQSLIERDDDPARTVAGCIQSLRVLEATDWKRYFEAVSTTDRVLRDDPAGVYGDMDFDTRDLYRKAVEILAEGTPTADEEAVAQTAIAMARAADAERARHVGYYLVDDDGRAAIERAIAYRAPWRVRGRRALLDAPRAVYLGAVGALTAALLAGLAAALDGAGAALILLALAAALVPAVTVAISIVNYTLTRLLRPRLLPRLDFSRAVPAPCATLVAVPALLTSAEEVEALIAALEIRFLANRDPGVHFAVLTDVCDAPAEELASDAELVDRAAAAIEALNQRYAAPNAPGPFHLLHRRRRWSDREACWMGWERKRGKLVELNRWLLGAEAAFELHVGDPGLRGQIRFVLVLDADTELPRDTARQLAATLAHPLNRAVFDDATGNVVAGYTILQPRVEISPLSADASRFAALFSPAAGLDPYTHAVSDVYQDLFGAGLFIGKGLYDVAAFERSLEGIVPDGTLLSHDLFEGIHGRVGLASDTVLFEDYPSRYLAHMRRVERWVRGDWQLLPWLRRTVRLADHRRGRNRLDLLARWKILDNLRRSLLPPALLLWLLVAWVLLPGSPLLWTVLAVAVPAVPLLIGAGGWLSATLRARLPGAKPAADPPSLRGAFGAWVCEATFLPHHASILITAIVRTLVRLAVTRRGLLQWTTAAQTARLLGASAGRRHMWREMLIAPLLAVAIGALLVILRADSLPAAAPLLLLWFTAPEIAHWLSQPREPRRPIPRPATERLLRIVARRTWSYFEAFVGPADQWLPPDSYQEEPHRILARRTSPTNIGLLQLATVSAVDLGYISSLTGVLHVKNTLDSLERAERHRGHFLNWYATTDLAPLEPRYVSTVDSGNLVACLIAVKQACLAFLQQPVIAARRVHGLLDTIAVLRDALDARRASELAGLIALLDQIEARVREWADDPRRWGEGLAELLDADCPSFDRAVLSLLDRVHEALDPVLLGEVRHWSAAIRDHAERWTRELDQLVPWLHPALRLPALPTAPYRGELAPIWRALEQLGVPTAEQLPAVLAGVREQAARVIAVCEAAALPAGADTLRDWAQRFDAALAGAGQLASYLRDRLAETAERADALVAGTDFVFLFDPARRLFRLGYNVSAGRMDDNHYDLLASEARLASFVAIAKGDVPDEHWLHLGRPIGVVAGERTLLSWSGTMFEYLMPTLLLREGDATLVGHSCRAAIHAQMAYAKRRGVPWGISESGYSRVDAQRNYQYRAFGVPGLGFKRGLEDDLVVAPYASLLAAPFVPDAVAENLQRLRELGCWGRHGLYEAIDFTPERRGSAEPVVVRSYMAHHQGMALAALTNVLADDSLVRRFHAEPSVKTSELLLHERPAGHAPLEQAQPAAARSPRQRRRLDLQPWVAAPDAPVPSTHLLSNGGYSVLTTARGDGGSRCRATTLTRWSPDNTFDHHGFRLYVHDSADGRCWSAFRDRDGEPPRVVFAPHMVERQARRDHLTVHERLVVVPGADVEIRHLTIGNDSRRRRRLRVIGYGEVVLGDAVTDRRHPAFSKLFIECEYVEADHALVFRRRPRAPGERTPYMAHALALPRSGARAAGHDASRETFLGRGGSLRAPAALGPNAGTLAGTTGATLDPVMALAADLDLPPHRTRELAFVTAVADSRQAALELVRRHGDLADVEWTIDVARHRAVAELEAIPLEPHHLPHLGELLALLLYAHPGLRADSETLSRNTAGRGVLWKHAISGDLPILLVRIGDAPRSGLLQLLFRAQAYWRGRGAAVDLVLLNERAGSYDATLDDAVARAVVAARAEPWMHRPGGIFVVAAAQIPAAERIALLSAARVVLDGAVESLADQLAAIPQPRAALPPLVVTAPDVAAGSPPLPRPADLLMDNGIGGFSPDGREYVIHLEPQAVTPAPWVNVVANPRCGFVVSERGGGYTWVGNAGENRLTPWRNDLVADEPGEAVYLRDEETGAVWTPTPQPAPGPGPYRIRHGAGYTVFQHQCRDLTQELRMFVPTDDPVKIVELALANTTARPRRITVTYCVEWVLGATRNTSQPYIVPHFDAGTEVLTARNPWNDDFGGAVAFVAAGQRLHGFTADRGEFFGRPGDRARPAALARIGLASTVQPGVDPCGALQVHVDLAPGESRRVHFILGQGDSHEAALALAQAYRDPAAVDAARAAAAAKWEGLLSARAVRTPDPALDLMLNRWLPYQTLAARVWGRTGYCQSSGAFGFRDQLQDVAALLPLDAALCRDHICAAAARQFEEGDVMHWWHPPSGAGLRSRCSDDLVWLPFVTAHYVAATGDIDLLSTSIPFLDAEPLHDDELERYGRFEPGGRSGSLYEHCLAALDRAQALGRHGLPLFGTGDWNDGMNHVGAAGRGESVWLGWFLYSTLTQFAPLCTQRQQPERAKDLLARAANLRRALHEHGWDGRWYRRGYYDDGQPLGSARHDECRIDSIAQSWAVISGAGEPERDRMAMQAVREQLIREPDGLILLFAPPFDRSTQEPGYIKGYPAGVRENGGQYTHAAIWTLWALAQLGDPDYATRLFRAALPTGAASTPQALRRYRGEPYVIAADVYGAAPYRGRGGWTWYTGSAGWAYRFGWEMLLGLRLEHGAWRIDPCIPANWPGFEVTLRDGATVYEIRVDNPDRVSRGVARAILDGKPLGEPLLPRLSDGALHRVDIVLGEVVTRSSAAG